MITHLRRLSILCRAHVWAILLALVVGAIYALPDVYHAHTSGYRGVVMADAPDEDLYLTNINKSYESKTVIGDALQYEYRDARNPFQFFGIEFALGKFGYLFHVPIDVLLQLMEFIFPLLLTLVLYAFAYKLSESRLAGFFASGAMLLGNEIVRPSRLSNMLDTFRFHGDYREFLNYSRPISPQINAIFFFAVLGLLLYFLRNPRSKWIAACAGVAVGLLIYIYIYFWAFAFVLLGVMFLYALATHDRAFLWTTGIALVASVACLSPFLLANLSIFLHGGESAITQAIPTHRIIVEKMILGPLFLYGLIYLWAWWSKGVGVCGAWASVFAKKYLFVLFLLVTGVIVSNQQVLTGKMVFQEHFHFFTNIPVLLLSVSLLCFEALTFVCMRWRVLAVGLLVVILAWFSLGVQISSYKAHREESVRYQKLAPILAYLRDQAAPDSVVLSDAYLSTRLTIYTQAYAYATGGLDSTFRVPRERLLHDYFVLLALRGVTHDSVRDYVYQTDHRNEIGGMIFISTYWRDWCGSAGCFPDSVLEGLIPAYQEFLSHPLLQNIQKYKADYVLVDRQEDSAWRLAQLKLGTPVVQSGDFVLYALPGGR